MVQLTDDLVARLDDEARARGVSRSALIRDAIEAGLSESREAELSRRIVAGYRRAPQGRPDEWGDLGTASRRSSLEALQRLDEEEGETW